MRARMLCICMGVLYVCCRLSFSTCRCYVCVWMCCMCVVCGAVLRVGVMYVFGCVVCVLYAELLYV